jgi:LysM repeat protein/predicted deacylase
MFIVLALLLLVACQPSAALEPPPAGASKTPGVTPLATMTEQPTKTITATASHLPRATTTPASATPAPSPTPTPSPAATHEPQVYEVRVGDTLTYIAARFATTSAAIQIANELLDANEISVGQELLIPAGQAGSSAPNTAILDYAARSILAIAATDSALTTPARDEGAHELTSADRGVTHNRFLCPAEIEPAPEDATLIGRSAVCRLPILSYRFGTGKIPLILVGGIHGGYEWNTILLANELRQYLQENPREIPSSLTVYLIPNANPDGLYAVTRRVGTFELSDLDEDTVPGRFNGRFVDLNRNWECQWQPVAQWGNDPVSGGAAPFSEPETQALRNYFLEIDPAAVLFWHSAAVGVYPAGCDHVDRASKDLAEIFASSAAYQVHDSFPHYEISGDAGNWLASKGIPSITVELTTHESLDWERNLAGLQALMRYIPSAEINRLR